MIYLWYMDICMIWIWFIIYYDLYLVGGIPAPLKNDGVRQLGWWHSQLNGKLQNSMVPNHQPVFISSGPVIFWCVFFFRSSKYPIVPESPKKTVVHPHWWKSHHLINSLLPTAGARIPSYQYIFGFVQGNSFMKPLFLPANIAGWWLTYPSEKYDSQLGWWHSKYMEKKTCSKPPTRWVFMGFF